MTPAGWKEATKGYNSKEVDQACIEVGILEPSPDGKSSKLVAIPGHGKARYYVIRAIGLARYHEQEAA
jgi:hypothetical protein